MEPTNDISQLILMWQDGDKAAENALFNALYRKLHGIAVNYLRREQRQLGATTLVHEAYLRLNRAENLIIHGRDHFLALVGRVMRRIIIDQARARRTRKRGVATEPLDAEISLVQSDQEAEEILAINHALDLLSKRAPRQAQIVELRYFAGFDEDETAAILHVSSRTVRRDWQIARTRLRIAVDGLESASSKPEVP